MSSSSKTWSSLPTKANPISTDQLAILDSEDGNPNTKNKTILVSSLPSIGSGIVSLNGDTSSAQFIAAGTGLGLVDAGATHTLSIDGTVVTLTGTQTLTNKTIDGALNTISNINETQQTVSVGISGFVLTSNGPASAPTYQAATGGGDMVLADIQTVTGAKTFGAVADVGKLIIAGNTSGTTILDAAAVAGSGTVVLPTTGTLSTLAGTETLTNKTFSLTNNTLTGTSAELATAISDETGSGLLVFGTSPTIVTPVIVSFATATHDHQAAAGGETLLSTAALSDTANIAYLNTANTFIAGNLNTFAHDATNPGIAVLPVAGNPTARADGAIWLNVSTQQMLARINGADVDLGAGAGGEIFTWSADHSMATFKLTATAANNVILNAPTGQAVSLEVAAAEEYSFNVTQADFNTNNIVNLGSLNTHTIPGGTDTFVLLAATQTLTNKTLTTPTIASFTNATHNHQAAAGGGQLTASLALATTGTPDATTFLRGDDTWVVPPAAEFVGPYTQTHDVGSQLLDNVGNLTLDGGAFLTLQGSNPGTNDSTFQMSTSNLRLNMVLSTGDFDISYAGVVKYQFDETIVRFNGVILDSEGGHLQDVNKITWDTIGTFNNDTIDFDLDEQIQTKIPLVDTTYLVANNALGKEKLVRIDGDFTARNVTFPAFAWTTSFPTVINSGESWYLRLFCWGAAIGDIEASIVLESSASDTSVGKQDLWVGVNQFTIVSTTAKEARVIGTGDNRKAIEIIPFSGSADQFAVAAFRFPRNWDNGVIKCTLIWVQDPVNTANQLQWFVSAVSVPNSGLLTDSSTDYGTEVDSFDAALTSGDIQHIVTQTADITIANTPATGDMIYFKVGRRGASDQNNVVSYLIGVSLEYTWDDGVASP